MSEIHVSSELGKSIAYFLHTVQEYDDDEIRITNFEHGRRHYAVFTDVQVSKLLGLFQVNLGNR